MAEVMRAAHPVRGQSILVFVMNMLGQREPLLNADGKPDEFFDPARAYQGPATAEAILADAVRAAQVCTLIESRPIGEGRAAS